VLLFGLAFTVFADRRNPPFSILKIMEEFMKKLFLILIAGFFVFGLSGCAKKTLQDHSVYYYFKHKQLAGKVYNLCNKFYPCWQNQKPDSASSAARLNNCSAAATAYLPQPKPPKLLTY
jgi:hypothetical protein